MSCIIMLWNNKIKERTLSYAHQLVKVGYPNKKHFDSYCDAKIAINNYFLFWAQD